MRQDADDADGRGLRPDEGFAGSLDRPLQQVQVPTTPFSKRSELGVERV